MFVWWQEAFSIEAIEFPTSSLQITFLRFHAYLYHLIFVPKIFVVSRDTYLLCHHHHHTLFCFSSSCLSMSELLLSESSAFAIIQISELKKKIWIFISLWLTATTHLCFLLLHGSPLHLMHTCLPSHWCRSCFVSYLVSFSIGSKLKKGVFWADLFPSLQIRWAVESDCLHYSPRHHTHTCN